MKGNLIKNALPSLPLADLNLIKYYEMKKIEM